jgi:hypothetical protein
MKKMVSLGVRTNSLITLHFGLGVGMYPAKKKINMDNSLLWMGTENKIIFRSAARVIQKLIRDI